MSTPKPGGSSKLATLEEPFSPNPAPGQPIQPGSGMENAAHDAANGRAPPAKLNPLNVSRVEYYTSIIQAPHVD
jgi:hypothetical protein